MGWKERISVKLGNIEEEEADGIVNAANRWLKGGGGVDGAIHRKAGEKLREALAKIGYCEVGKAVVTPGFNLKAKYIIHTVGPVYRGRREDEELLESAYLSALKIANEKRMGKVAFPLISTGAYGYPKREGIRVALRAMRRFLEKEGFPEKVVFVVHGEETLRMFKEELERMG